MMSRKNKHQHEGETRHDREEERDAARAMHIDEAGGEAERLDDLERQIAELEGRYKRALADYQNYQRRAIENERRALEMGRASVVESLVPVLDHFRMALQMDVSKTSTEQLLGGVKSILSEFEKVMGGFGVTTISPSPNDEFDPNRHEAMLRSEGAGIEPGHVVATLQAGYAMGDRVIRPAKVSVSPAREETSGSGEGED